MPPETTALRGVIVSRMDGSEADQTVANNERAIALLVSDLYWQIDQLPRRGIKDSAGNPYIPAYYKRGYGRRSKTVAYRWPTM